jgi:hypothetical protein
MRPDTLIAQGGTPYRLKWRQLSDSSTFAWIRTLRSRASGRVVTDRPLPASASLTDTPPCAGMARVA